MKKSEEAIQHPQIMLNLKERALERQKDRDTSPKDLEDVMADAENLLNSKLPIEDRESAGEIESDDLEEQASVLHVDTATLLSMPHEDLAIRIP